MHDIPNIRELPDPDLDAPAAVELALEFALDAGTTLEQAKAEHASAEAQVKQAVAADKAADTAAVAAGESLPSENKAAPDAEAAAKETRRKVDAAVASYRDALVELTKAIIDERASWEAELNAQTEAANAAVAEALATYREQAEELAAIAATRESLEPFHGGRKRLLTAWGGTKFRIKRMSPERRQEKRSGASRVHGETEAILLELELRANGQGQ